MRPPKSADVYPIWSGSKCWSGLSNTWLHTFRHLINPAKRWCHFLLWGINIILDFPLYHNSFIHSFTLSYHSSFSPLTPKLFHLWKGIRLGHCIGLGCRHQYKSNKYLPSAHPESCREVLFLLLDNTSALIVNPNFVRQGEGKTCMRDKTKYIYFIVSQSFWWSWGWGALCLMEFLGQGSDLSCSCNLRCSCSNAGSLTHCAWPEIQPTSQRSRVIADSVAPQRELLYHNLFFLVLFVFSELNPQQIEVPRLQVKLELQLLAHTIATTMQELSCICDLHHSSRQPRILNPLRKARDWTHVLMDTSRVC